MEISPNDKSNIKSITGNMSADALTKTNIPLKIENTNPQYGGVSDGTQPLIAPVSKGKAICSYLKTLTIEPALFTFMFGYIMQMSCITNLMMDKGCLYYYNYSEELCSNLKNHTAEKEKVEILANDYSMYSNLMSLIAAFVMILIAPWSDKYGRKFPMAMSMVGTIIGDVCTLVCVINFDSSLYYLVLSKIPAQIFGGFICVMTVVFSHASEVSSEKARTLKYATVEISMGLSLATGGLAGGSLLRYYGYFSVYLTAVIIHYISFIWVIFFVQETRRQGVRATWGQKIKDFFKLDNFSAGCKASMKHREHNGRILIFLYFVSMCVIILTYESFGSIGFTYVHQIYNWDPLTYNSATTIFQILGMVALIVGIPLVGRVYTIKDYSLGITGSISMVGKFFILAFARWGVYLFYIGYVVGCLSGISTLAVRSGISKLLDKDELGLVFSFLATCESILPMFGTIFITKVFNATLSITPSVTYLMTAFLLLMPLGTFIFSYHLTKKRQASELKEPI